MNSAPIIVVKKTTELKSNKVVLKRLKEFVSLNDMESSLDETERMAQISGEVLEKLKLMVSALESEMALDNAPPINTTEKVGEVIDVTVSSSSTKKKRKRNLTTETI